MRKFFTVLPIFILLVLSSAKCSYSASPPDNYLADRIEKVRNMSFNAENITFPYAKGKDLVSKAQNDKKFMNLLAARLRLVILLSSNCDIYDYAEESVDMCRYVDTNIGSIISLLTDGQTIPPEKLVETLTNNAIDKVVVPLGLTPLIRELPKYYEAVVKTEDWESNCYIEGGIRARDIYLAGFKKLNKEPYYREAFYFGWDKNDKFSLGDCDVTMESWLYSFWLRRYEGGTMEVAKMALDYLNKALDARGIE